jgi:hypothetical protein
VNAANPCYAPATPPGAGKSDTWPQTARA